MLRIAVQSKGRLFEDTMALLSEAGIPVRSGQLEEGRVSVQLDPQQLDAAMQLIHDEMVLKQ